MSARGAVALQQGATEELLAKVDDYHNSDLTPAQKAALQLADAYLGSPADLTDAVRIEAAEQLTAGQAVEVVLKLMGFSSDKVMVALGLDMDEVRIFEM